MPRIPVIASTLLLAGLLPACVWAQPDNAAPNEKLKALLDSAHVVQEGIAGVAQMETALDPVEHRRRHAILKSCCKRGAAHLSSLEAHLSSKEMNRETSGEAGNVLRELRDALDMGADLLEVRSGDQPVVAESIDLAELLGEADTLHSIYFDDNSSYVTESVERIKLRDLAMKMKYAPALKIELTPYADGTGDVKYSKWLCERRAERIRNLFIEAYEVVGDRILVNEVVLTSETGQAARKVLIRELE